MLKQLVIFTIATAVLSAGNFDGCIFNNGNFCQECYKKQLTNPPSNSCGAAATGNCRIYKYDRALQQAVCGECEDGYILVIAKKNGKLTSTCTAGKTIHDCGKTEHYLNFPVLCIWCKNGQYSKLNQQPLSSKCVPASQIDQPVKNCAQGGLVRGGAGVCHRCNAGYATSIDGSACIKPSITGCIKNPFTDKFKCRECDYLNGYFMNAAGNCVKTA